MLTAAAVKNDDDDDGGTSSTLAGYPQTFFGYMTRMILLVVLRVTLVYRSK